MMLHEFIFFVGIIHILAANDNSYVGEKLPNLLYDISRENFCGFTLGK